MGRAFFFGCLILMCIFLARGTAEAMNPPRNEGSNKVLVFSRGTHLAFVVVLLIFAGFAVALAGVEREPALELLGCFLLFAVPGVSYALAIFGWKIVVTPESITRSCFGRFEWERKTSQLMEISYSQTCQAYTLRFADGGKLCVSVLMQGSHQVAFELEEALPKVQFAEGEIVLVYETPVRISASLFLVMGSLAECLIITGSHGSPLAEIICFLMLVVFPVAGAFEYLGRKITVTSGSIGQSYFGFMEFEKNRSQLVNLSYSRFRVSYMLHFADGKKLGIPTAMKGSLRFVGILKEALAKSGLAA